MNTLIDFILTVTDRSPSTGGVVRCSLGAVVSRFQESDPERFASRVDAFPDQDGRYRSVPSIVDFHLRRAAQAYLSVVGGLFGDDGGIFSILRQDLKLSETVELYAHLDFWGLLIPFIKTRTVTLTAHMLNQSDVALSVLRRCSSQCREALAGLTITDELWREEDLLGPGDVSLGLGILKKRCRTLWAPHRVRPNRLEDWYRLAQNVTYIKRSMPPMSPWEIEFATSQHKAGMSEPHRLSVDPEIRSEHRDRIKAWIRLIVDCVYARARFIPKEPVPSAKSCFERGQTGGGSLVELFGSLARDHSVGPSVFDDYVYGSDLDRLVEVEPGKVIEFRTSRKVQMLLDRFTELVNRQVGQRHRPKGTCPFCTGELRYDEYCLHVDVLPAAICEPCKVRMITMGNASVYQRALVLQKFLWGRLKADSHFQWTAGSISEESWNESFPTSYLQKFFTLYPQAHFVSGDYKASTDNLDPEISEYVWSCICDTVQVLTELHTDRFHSSEDGTRTFYEGFRGFQSLAESGWKEIGLSCLTQHILHHGQTREEALAQAGVGSIQRWGQLMGSPVSFPILNIANAAASCAVFGPPTPLGTRPRDADDWTDWRINARHYWYQNPNCMYTNGDDIAFVSPNMSFTQRWYESTSSVGLSPSAGKNFISSDFVQINSEMRCLARAHGPLEELDDIWGQNLLVWHYVPFLNLPLLFGCGAKGPAAGRDIQSEIPCFTVGPIARQLVRGCGAQLAKTRLQQWRNFYRPLLSRVPPGVIWECPESLGGLGVPSFSDIQAPEDARKRCAWLACLDTMSRLREVTPPRPEPLLPWLKALGKAMNVGYCVERKVEAPPDQKGFSQTWGPPAGGRGATLGEFLRSWSPAELDVDALNLLHLATKSVQKSAQRKSLWCRLLKQNRAEVYVVASVESAWRRHISRQWKKVHEATVVVRDPWLPDVRGFMLSSRHPSSTQRDIRDADGYIIDYARDPNSTVRDSDGFIVEYNRSVVPVRPKKRHAPLQPMKSSRIASWNDRHVLLQEILAPNYDVSFTL